MAGDVVGVVVRLQYVVDRNRHVPGQLEILVDLKARIDDRRHTRPDVADQVRGATEIIVRELPKEHLANDVSGKDPLRGQPTRACASARGWCGLPGV